MKMTEDYYNNVLVMAQNKLKEKGINDYNKGVIKLILKPKNWGSSTENEISVSQSYKGPCGDTMQFFLKIQDNIIEKAKFITTGCGASIAAASQTTILIKGKSLEFAENLKPNEIDKALGGLPDDHKHCAELAIKTLRNAIKKYKLIRQ
jgi:nitrogen fixation NifU-like protein